MGDKKTGFALLDKAEHLRVAARGGRSAKRRHRWSTAEAIAAGRKGGLTRALRDAERRENLRRERVDALGVTSF
jgi:hypothetical protein